MTFLEIKQGMNKLFVQKFRKKMNTKKLKYKDFSFISVNCLGGVISHDLGLQFLSPTINLFFESEDYIKFVENLQYYLKLELEEDTAEESYPVGKLGDIRIFFFTLCIL